MGQIKYNQKTEVLYREWSIIEGIELRDEWKEDNDCAVRAIASATGCTYKEAHDYCRIYLKRKNNDGSIAFGRKMDERIGMPFLNGTKYKEVEFDKPLTIKEFMKNYSGIYILAITGHVFTIKYKCIIGNPEDNEDVHRIVNFAYKIYKA